MPHEVYTEDFDLRHGSTFAGNALGCRRSAGSIDLDLQQIAGHFFYASARQLIRTSGSPTPHLFNGSLSLCSGTISGRGEE
jgi:hypothetical protein